MKPTLKAVLFDLDGTLLDTAPDLAYALNSLLISQQRQPLPFAQIRAVASHGSKGLLKLGFNITEAAAEFDTLKTQLLTIYHQNIARQTRVFNGINQVLTCLKEQALPWGIVTNKPAWLTEPLLQAISFDTAPACIVSGDTVSRAKPFPDSLLYACNLIDCAADECLYIGDAERDIQAGKNAGMQTLVALYGYLAADDKPLQWQANGTVETPEEIVEWIRLFSR